MTTNGHTYERITKEIAKVQVKDYITNRFRDVPVDLVDIANYVGPSCKKDYQRWQAKNWDYLSRYGKIAQSASAVLGDGTRVERPRDGVRPWFEPRSFHFISGQGRLHLRSRYEH